MSDQPNTPDTPQSTEAELIAVRREKLAKMRELGIDPYGGKFDTTITPGNLKAKFEDEMPVTIAGRLLAIRDMGKSVFATIGDAEGRIQIYLNKKGVSEQDWEAYQLLDLGDWIGVDGETFTTGKGEPSVKVEKLTVLSKSLRPMPDKWHGVADRETKYRKRHLDLMSNEASAQIFITRSKMIAELRSFLHGRGYLEVETPCYKASPAVLQQGRSRPTTTPSVWISLCVSHQSFS